MELTSSPRRKTYWKRSPWPWEVPSPISPSELLSEVPYAAFLAYSPRGAADVSRRSQHICHKIKTDGVIGSPPERAIDLAVARLAKLGTVELKAFLTPDVTLVPCPKSAPFPPKLKPVLWVPLRICETLRAQGYGSKILPCLTRVEAVRKSAFAPPGDRPSTLRHFETMEVDSSLDDSRKITLVDDVVTKGATLLAAASLLTKAFPRAQVGAFALVRTMGLVPDIERIVDPVVGRIRRTPQGHPIREP